MASEIKVDTISEKTSAGGVTIDGLLIKDGGISGDVSLIGTTPTFTIGDAGAEDAALVFDGNAQDYYIALDDSADDLLIGLGSTVGTTPAISIDENLAIKTYGDITMTGTTPVLTIGDAGAEDAAIVFDGNAQDYYIALDDSADDLLIGLGSGVGTTPFIAIKSDGDIHLPVDEKGLVFGAGADVYFGSNEGEQGFIFTAGASFAALNTSPGIQMICEDAFTMQFFAGEGKGPILLFRADQSDDNADRWYIGNADTSSNASSSFNFLDYEAGAIDMEMSLLNTGVLNVEGAVNASTSVDYAEYFEWKTELANDDKIVDTYGLSVVLDNGKVRLAEAGEEAKVLGVVRPNNVSAVVGGSEEFKYKDKYEKNVWGETVMEEYTLVKWNETRTRYWKDGDTLPEGVSVGDVRGTYVHQHEYHRDRIPSKVF